MKAETREKIKANWQLFKESLPIFLPSQVLLLLAALNLYVPMRRTMHGVLLILHALALLGIWGIAMTYMKRRGRTSWLALTVPWCVSSMLLDAWVGKFAGHVSLMSVLLSVAAGVIVTVLTMLADEKALKAQHADYGIFARIEYCTVIFVMASVLSSSWMSATNIAFANDEPVRSVHAYVSSKTDTHSNLWHIFDGKKVKLRKNGSTNDYNNQVNFCMVDDALYAAIGSDATVTEYAGVWGAPYYTLSLPQGEK